MKLQLKNCSKRHFQHLVLSHQTVAQTHQLQFILLRLYSANKRDNTVTKISIAFKNARKSHVCASGFLFILINNVNLPSDSVNTTTRRYDTLRNSGQLKNTVLKEHTRWQNQCRKSLAKTRTQLHINDPCRYGAQQFLAGLIQQTCRSVTKYFSHTTIIPSQHLYSEISFQFPQKDRQNPNLILCCS